MFSILTMAKPRLSTFLLCSFFTIMLTCAIQNDSTYLAIEVANRLPTSEILFCKSRELDAIDFYTCPLEIRRKNAGGTNMHEDRLSEPTSATISEYGGNHKKQKDTSSSLDICEEYDTTKYQFWRHEAILKRLKTLKFKRMLDRKKIKVGTRIEKYVRNNFPTSHCDTQPLTATENSFKAILDNIENIVNRAARKESESLLNQAIASFEELLKQANYPSRLLVQIGEALALAYHFNNSMVTFRQSIDTFEKVLILDEVSDDLFRIAATKSVELLCSVSWYSEAILIQEFVCKRFPFNAEALNTLGSIYLHQAKLSKGIYADIQFLLKAKDVFKRSLYINPDDKYAIVNLGYISYFEIFEFASDLQNTQDSELKRVKDAAYLILSGYHDTGTETNTIVSKLGFALAKTRNIEPANQLFENAAKTGLFPTFWQRGEYYQTDIRSKPIWNINETKMECFLKGVRYKWKAIRNEALEIYQHNLFTIQNENIRDTGSWEVYTLFILGKKINENCIYAPITCKLFESLPQIANNRYGSVKFSLMKSGTHVYSHSGPTNARLRAHLGLDIPGANKNISSVSPSRLRVLNEYLKWANGEIFIFDDSFDHEVWHFNQQNGSRLILIFDIWHPELTELQIATI